MMAEKLIFDKALKANQAEQSIGGKDGVDLKRVYRALNKKAAERVGTDLG